MQNRLFKSVYNFLLLSVLVNILLLFLLREELFYKLSPEISARSEFETMKEAKESDLAKKGWVDKRLPDEATQVQIRTNSDTNEVIYKFKLK